VPNRNWKSALLLLFLGVVAGAAASLHAVPPQEAAAASLGYEFFKSKVQPIFLARREGHARCVACHSYNNSALKLQPLDKGSRGWTEEESRKNFEAAQKVAMPGNLTSPLLIHPLAEAAGGDFFHGGGKHFNSQNDPEWTILKAWVMGADAP
jgi:hypothetical protein